MTGGDVRLGRDRTERSMDPVLGGALFLEEGVTRLRSFLDCEKTGASLHCKSRIKNMLGGQKKVLFDEVRSH